MPEVNKVEDGAENLDHPPGFRTQYIGEAEPIVVYRDEKLFHPVAET